MDFDYAADATGRPVQLYLASASPRRRELLTAIGVRFRRIAQDADESRLPDETPADYVSRLALAKARAGQAGLPPGDADGPPVLGADTAVVIDGRILGKPRDRGHAVEMLRQLSDRTHRVFSAVALRRRRREAVRLSVSDVTFRPLDDEAIERYWLTGEPADKAGAYGVQGLGSTFVRNLNGSHSGVMGLPLFETAELLAAFGVALWPASGATS